MFNCVVADGVTVQVSVIIIEHLYCPILLKDTLLIANAFIIVSSRKVPSLVQLYLIIGLLIVAQVKMTFDPTSAVTTASFALL